MGTRVPNLKFTALTVLELLMTGPLRTDTHYSTFARKVPGTMNVKDPSLFCNVT